MSFGKRRAALAATLVTAVLAAGAPAATAQVEPGPALDLSASVTCPLWAGSVDAPTACAPD